jgi:hypothetical protein
LERTLISWNLPNMITIPLMAAIGFLAVAVVWQLIAQGRSNAVSSAGYTGAQNV